MSLEVDGDVGGPQLERSRTRPAWGMPVAIVLVCALVLGVGWSVLRSGGSASTSGQSAVATPTTAGSAPSTTDVPLVVGGVPSTVADTPTPDLRDPVRAASAALAAWGHFASSGDLSQVRATFVADGPQLRKLEHESAQMEPAASDGYRVVLTDATVDGGEDTVTVTGSVTWSRAGEAEQFYRWAIELRLVDGTWQLFTVRSLAS